MAMPSQRPYNREISAVSLYVLLVMGGTALLLNLYIALGGGWYFDSHGYIHQGFFTSLFTGIALYLKIVTSVLVLGWCFIAALLYLSALFLLWLFNKRVISAFLLGILSLILTAGIFIWLPPVPHPSLPALYLEMMVGGVLGALFGGLLGWRVPNVSFRTASLGLKYVLPIGIWGMVFVFGLTYIAYAGLKISLVKDPPIEFVFVKWSPGDGEVHEEPTGPYDSMFPSLKASELNMLRAEGMTGT